jgi:hypothetical protein
MQVEKMQLAGKETSYYMKVVKKPFMIMLAIAAVIFLVQLVLELAPYFGMKGGGIESMTRTANIVIYFLKIGTGLVGAFLAGYVGWAIVRHEGGTISNSAAGGLIYGVLTVVVNDVVTVIFTVLSLVGIGMMASQDPATGTSGLFGAIAVAGGLFSIVFWTLLNTILAVVFSVIGGALADTGGSKP